MTPENPQQSAPLEAAATGLLPRRGSGRGGGKPGRSGPPGNSNARTHGTHSLRHAIKVLGNRAISRRTKVGRALAAWRADLVADLGGDVSTQQAALIDLAVRTRLLVDSVDAYVLGMDSPVNKKRRMLYPVVRERQALVNQLQSLLRDLGLERRAKPVADLTSFLSSRETPHGDAPT